jgi:hypothetical protein
MTWVVARVIKSDKDAVDVSGEWETKRAGDRTTNTPARTGGEGDGESGDYGDLSDGSNDGF